MTATATNQWKVGAFIVGGVVSLLLALFWLGASRFDTDVVTRVTYLDESVQGLEIGAPVKIRGVSIGKVTDILLAPDHRLVEVQAEIRVDVLRGINVLGEGEQLGDSADEVPSELRLIVSTQGITGVKFLEADFFPDGTPTPELSFKAPDNYVPSTPSTLKSLEDAVRGLGDELPLALKDMRTLMNTLESQTRAVDTAALSDAILMLAEDLHLAFTGTATTGLGSEISGLVTDLRALTQRLDSAVEAAAADGGTIARATTSVEDVAGRLGTLATRIDGILADSDLPAASKSIRAAADSAARLADGLSPAIQDAPSVTAELRQALRAIGDLARLLERDPGVLLRGRGPNPAK